MYTHIIYIQCIRFAFAKPPFTKPPFANSRTVCIMLSGPVGPSGADIYIYIYICIYIYRERERERPSYIYIYIYIHIHTRIDR